MTPENSIFLIAAAICGLTRSVASFQLILELLVGGLFAYMHLFSVWIGSVQTIFLTVGLMKALLALLSLGITGLIPLATVSTTMMTTLTSVFLMFIALRIVRDCHSSSLHTGMESSLDLWFKSLLALALSTWRWTLALTGLLQLGMTSFHCSNGTRTLGKGNAQ